MWWFLTVVMCSIAEVMCFYFLLGIFSFRKVKKSKETKKKLSLKSKYTEKYTYLNWVKSVHPMTNRKQFCLALNLKLLSGYIYYTYEWMPLLLSMRQLFNFFFSVLYILVWTHTHTQKESESRRERLFSSIFVIFN